MKCELCDGTGDCPSCDGTGLDAGKIAGGPCDFCNGTGICPECHGGGNARDDKA